MIKLGNIVRDRLTPFRGTVIARAEYLYGCVWVEIAPCKVGADYIPAKSVWMDENRVMVIKEKQEKFEPNIFETGVNNYGGPMESAPRRSVPGLGNTISD